MTLTAERRARNLLAPFAVLCTITATAVQAADPVSIRLAADLTGPPHPAGIAMEFFAERLAEELPGSEVRTFYAGSLYKIPEAMAAMTDGDLEMTWGQYGKSTQIEPMAALVVGPQLLTTVGAINQLDQTDTLSAIRDQFADRHDIRLLGSAHQSLFIGIGATSRLRAPDDFEGKKIRSPDPLTAAALDAWGASATTMSFGDVPPALQTGVIDGLVTSLNGFNATKDQAPYFTVAGLNGIMGDFYWIAASGSWWDGLSDDQRQIISNLITDEVIPLQRQLNWCNDQRIVSEFRTDDPSEPGIYVMNADERNAMADKLGDARNEWVRQSVPADVHDLVDGFQGTARTLSAENPSGSDSLESTNCEEIAPFFTRYGG